MIVKNKKQKQAYREAAQKATSILEEASKQIKPGVYPLEIDEYFKKLCDKHGVKPSFYGVSNGDSIYKHNSCISVNDVTLHGIPDNKRKLQEGDIVKLDFGIIDNGLYTDQCFTFSVGQPTDADKSLMEAGKKATEAALPLAVTGTHSGDLGNAMRTTAQKHGFDVIKGFVGHGIGNSLWEPPQIDPHGKPDTGSVLEKGMVICIECQVVAGNIAMQTDPDGWTVRTKDGKNSVMVEYMVVVDDKKPHILTPMQEWPQVLD